MQRKEPASAARPWLWCVIFKYTFEVGCAGGRAQNVQWLGVYEKRERRFHIFTLCPKLKRLARASRTSVNKPPGRLSANQFFITTSQLYFSLHE